MGGWGPSLILSWGSGYGLGSGLGLFPGGFWLWFGFWFGAFPLRVLVWGFSLEGSGLGLFPRGFGLGLFPRGFGVVWCSVFSCVLLPPIKRRRMEGIREMFGKGLGYCCIIRNIIAFVTQLVRVFTF